MKKILLCLLLSLFAITSIAQKKPTNCGRLKHSKLHYLDSESKDSYVLIDNNKHTEYFDANGGYLKSELVWVNDCEYNAKIVEMNIPGAPFKVGDKLNVKIVKIENGIVFMLCTFQGYVSEAQYEIIEYL